METRSRKKLAKERMAKSPFPSSIEDKRLEQTIRNPVILEAIFLHCPIKTLKHCRLVSKQWYDLSLEQWRSRAVLKLESVQIKRALRYQQFFGNPYKNLEHPFASMMKFETRPYRRLQIGKGFPREVHAQYLVKFLAPHLHELRLDSSIDNDFWIKLIFELTPNLKKLLVKDAYFRGLKDLTFCANHEQQNLKKLELRRCYNLPVTWHALLSTFTKLEVILLPVRNTCFGERDDFCEFLCAVKRVKSKNPDNLPVHHLDVLSRSSYKGDKFIPESIPTLLSDVNFPLKTLKIDVPNNATEAVFQRLLNLYCRTLESLVIMRVDKDRDHQHQASSFLSPFVELMKSLKSLEIFGPILKDMSCLQYTPNLEKLSICERSFSGYFSEKDERDLTMFSSSTQMVNEVIEDVELSKLREFNTYFTLENAAPVKTLGSWMPNLETLRVRVTSGDGFGEMCSQWGNTLRELVLGSRSFLVDDDITGFTIGQEKDKRSRVPNVTLLKNLQVFRMEEYICSQERPTFTWPRSRNDNESDSDNESADIDCIKSFSKITDHAVHNGFLQLAQLHTLELQSTEAMEVKARSLLQRKGIDVTARIRTACTCPRPLTYEEHRKERMRISRIRY